jgi:hypothetical protein
MKLNTEDNNVEFVTLSVEQAREIEQETRRSIPP